MMMTTISATDSVSNGSDKSPETYPGTYCHTRVEDCACAWRLEMERHAAPRSAADPAIYFASKTTHAERWRAIRATGRRVVSTWIDEAGVGETSSFEDLWKRCITEASQADYLIVFRQPGEVLKGAFVEVGAALSSGRKVLAVGCEDLSFSHHRLVTSVLSIDQALDMIDAGKTGFDPVETSAAQS